MNNKIDNKIDNKKTKIVSFRFNNHLIKEKQKELSKIYNEKNSEFKNRLIENNLGYKGKKEMNFNKYNRNIKYKKNINNLDEEIVEKYKKKINEIEEEYDKRILENFNKYINKKNTSKNNLFDYVEQGNTQRMFGPYLKYKYSKKIYEILPNTLLYYIVNILGLKDKDSLSRLYDILNIIYKDFKKNQDKELLRERCNAILFLINKNINNNTKQSISNAYSYHPNRVIEHHWNNLSNESKETFKNLKNKT